MRITINLWLVALVIYSVAALGTFGWVRNHTGCNGSGYCDTRDLGAGMAGAFWPIYWSGTIALSLTK